MPGRTRRLAMAATTTMSRMWRGRHQELVRASAHASLPVQSSTWRQIRGRVGAAGVGSARRV